MSHSWIESPEIFPCEKRGSSSSQSDIQLLVPHPMLEIFPKVPSDELFDDMAKSHRSTRSVELGRNDLLDILVDKPTHRRGAKSVDSRAAQNEQKLKMNYDVSARRNSLLGLVSVSSSPSRTPSILSTNSSRRNSTQPDVGSSENEGNTQDDVSKIQSIVDLVSEQLSASYDVSLKHVGDIAASSKKKFHSEKCPLCLSSELPSMSTPNHFLNLESVTMNTSPIESNYMIELKCKKLKCKHLVHLGCLKNTDFDSKLQKSHSTSTFRSAAFVAEDHTEIEEHINGSTMGTGSRLNCTFELLFLHSVSSAIILHTQSHLPPDNNNNNENNEISPKTINGRLDSKTEREFVLLSATMEQAEKDQAVFSITTGRILFMSICPNTNEVWQIEAGYDLSDNDSAGDGVELIYVHPQFDVTLTIEVIKIIQDNTDSKKLWKINSIYLDLGSPQPQSIHNSPYQTQHTLSNNQNHHQNSPYLMPQSQYHISSPMIMGYPSLQSSGYSPYVQSPVLLPMMPIQQMEKMSLWSNNNQQEADEQDKKYSANQSDNILLTTILNEMNLPASDTNGENENSFASSLDSVAKIAQCQVGSRYLQQKFEKCITPQDYEFFNCVFYELRNHFSVLMVDLFGNYLCQKIIKLASSQQRATIVRNILPELTKISCDRQGTRSIQRLVEMAETDEEYTLFLNHFLHSNNQHNDNNDNDNNITTNDNDYDSNRLLVLMKNPNGAHVIHAILTHFPLNLLDPIFDVCFKHVDSLATHQFGLCVLKKCLVLAPPSVFFVFANLLLNNVDRLVNDQYGNYVMQYIIQRCSLTVQNQPSDDDNNNNNATSPVIDQHSNNQNKEEIDMAPIINVTPQEREEFISCLGRTYNALRGHFYSLSKHKYSSNVVEKILSVEVLDIQINIISEFLACDKSFHLLEDSFGNYVIQKALLKAKGEQALGLLEKIETNLNSLRRNVQKKWKRLSNEKRISLGMEPVYSVVDTESDYQNNNNNNKNQRNNNNNNGHKYNQNNNNNQNKVHFHNPQRHHNNQRNPYHNNNNNKMNNNNNNYSAGKNHNQRNHHHKRTKQQYNHHHHNNNNNMNNDYNNYDAYFSQWSTNGNNNNNNYHNNGPYLQESDQMWSSNNNHEDGYYNNNNNNHQNNNSNYQQTFGNYQNHIFPSQIVNNNPPYYSEPQSWNSHSQMQHNNNQNNNTNDNRGQNNHQQRPRNWSFDVNNIGQY